MPTRQANIGKKKKKAYHRVRFAQDNKEVDRLERFWNALSVRDDDDDDESLDKIPVSTLPQAPPQPFRSYLVTDFEATCEEGINWVFPNEIIEWPIVLLQDKHWHRGSCASTKPQACTAQHALTIVREFRTLVKPIWNDRLSDFCISLTGIQQSDIDRAPNFTQSIQLVHDELIRPHHLFARDNPTAWVSDGPWDMRDFVEKTTWINGFHRRECPWLGVDRRKEKLERFEWMAGILDFRMPGWVDVRLGIASYVASRRERGRQQLAEQRFQEQLESTAKLEEPKEDSGGLNGTSQDQKDDDFKKGKENSDEWVPVQHKQFTTSSRSRTRPLKDQHTRSSGSSGTTTAQVEAPHSHHPRSSHTIGSISYNLERLGLEPFIGQEHSGIDDARNIARLLMKLDSRGWRLDSNRHWSEAMDRRWAFMGSKRGDVRWPLNR